MDASAQSALAESGDSPAAGAGDFGDEAAEIGLAKALQFMLSA